MKKYDAIIIGGGHNGLVTAAYLARAGKKVAIFEKRKILGGCSSTEELWPGYKVSPAAYVISLFPPQIINDLKLKTNFGLEILPRNPISSFTPDHNGPGLALGGDKKGNLAEIERYSKNDAYKFAKYEDWLEEIVKKIETIIDSVPPQIAATGRKLPLRKKLLSLFETIHLGKSFNSLDENLSDAVELLTGAATPILERWFESDILKATLATDAIIGSFTSPSQQGSAYVLFHHVMGEAGGARGRWGYIRGGMGGLADSLEKACKKMGVDMFIDEEVKKIIINEVGRATGIRTSKGEYNADIIASNLDPNLTFNYLVGFEKLPGDFAGRIKNIDYTSATAKINFALDRLPDFKCGKDVERKFPVTGTIHIPNTLREIEKAFDQAKYGHPSTDPILEITIPTTIDKTIAPEGKHIMSVLFQYAPYKLDKSYENGWDGTIRNNLLAETIFKIEEYAPGFEESIIDWQILTPLDLERTYGLTGGNIFQGSMILSQMFSSRPVLGWSDHRTPIKGLYICGSAAHPGGGVTGIPGRNAANEILKD